MASTVARAAFSSPASAQPDRDAGGAWRGHRAAIAEAQGIGDGDERVILSGNAASDNPLSQGWPRLSVSVKARPPVRPAASSTRTWRPEPRNARPAASPAAPAPTMTTSHSLSCTGHHPEALTKRPPKPHKGGYGLRRLISCGRRPAGPLRHRRTVGRIHPRRRRPWGANPCGRRWRGLPPARRRHHAARGRCPAIAPGGTRPGRIDLGFLVRVPRSNWSRTSPRGRRSPSWRRRGSAAFPGTPPKERPTSSACSVTVMSPELVLEHRWSCPRILLAHALRQAHARRAGIEREIEMVVARQASRATSVSTRRTTPRSASWARRS